MRKEYGNVNLIEARPGRDAPRSDEAVFMRTARGFLCRKAGLDPHDVKFPAAMFEDARRVSPEWRPYLLACSVHALHGEKSADSTTLTKVRQALG
jgi:hypothetical protein